MRIPAVGGALLLAPAVLVAQVQATRWAVQIRSAVGVEHADLRLDASGGRLLLESHDSAFLPLAKLQRSATRISFTIPALGQRIEADVDVSTAAMRGRLTLADGGVSEWQAQPLQPGVSSWPVRPRVRVRQLAFGSRANVTVIPAAWAAAMVDSASLERDYAALVHAAALPVVSAAARPARSRAMALGLDEATRVAVRRVLERIADGPAADSSFRRLFVGGGGLRVDVHQRAEEFAGQLDRRFRHAAAARALRLDGRVTAATLAEPAQLREAALSLWPEWRRGDSVVARRLARVREQDPEAMRALEALLEGYDQAVPWWREAVRWLLLHPWLETTAGFRAPAQLMAAFWGRDSLPLPVILAERMGGFEAMPLMAGSRLALRLIEPVNASAREWLATDRGEALATWRTLHWADSLTLASTQGDVALVAPDQAVALAPLLAAGDGVRIDPGIVPLLAVATVIHEWHHIMASESRLTGAAPALLEADGVLLLREDDPWLAEGFAEWATEETLRPARGSVPLLTLLDTEKRMALWGGMSDDPHATGYRLVRAVAGRLRPAVRRATLVATLHSPASAVRLARFPIVPRAMPLLLRRPVTAAVVPETTFTWDAGVADQPVRRLLLPPFPPEH